MAFALLLLVAVGAFTLLYGQSNGQFDAIDTQMTHDTPYPVWVVEFSLGVAQAEGYYRPGTLPARNLNPGDLLDSGGANISFPSELDGFNACYRQAELIFDNRSRAGYASSDSVLAIAQRWTGGDSVNTPGSTQGWAQTVVNHVNSVAGSNLTTDNTMDDIRGAFGG